mgnify:CR=1 FL=1
MRIENVIWDVTGEVYFTLKRDDGVIGKVQLNMAMIIEDDWYDEITWREEE